MNLKLDYLPSRENIKLYQDHDYICLNTDTMVLGEFLEVYRDDVILDIGTNNGALLLYASRFNAKKYIGIDINKGALEIAKKNLELNNIFNYELKCVVANNYKEEPVDVIVTNPPYFEENVINKNLNEKINIAKHDDLLKLEDLIKCVNLNLKDNGKLFLLYQSSRLEEVVILLNKYHLRIKELKFVYNVNKDNSNVVLIKAVKNARAHLEVKKPIIIKDMKII